MTLNYKIGRVLGSDALTINSQRGKWVPIRKAVDATQEGQWLPVTLEDGQTNLLQRNVFSWTHRAGASRTYHTRLSGKTIYISWEAKNGTRP